MKDASSRASGGGGRWVEGASLRSLALIYGLSLTHHRTMVLLAPAMAVFILWVDRGLFKRGREWAIVKPSQG